MYFVLIHVYNGSFIFYTIWGIFIYSEMTVDSTLL